jgi:hypothetical protein
VLGRGQPDVLLASPRRLPATGLVANLFPEEMDLIEDERFHAVGRVFVLKAEVDVVLAHRLVVCRQDRKGVRLSAAAGRRSAGKAQDALGSCQTER